MAENRSLVLADVGHAFVTREILCVWRPFCGYRILGGGQAGKEEQEQEQPFRLENETEALEFHPAHRDRRDVSLAQSRSRRLVVALERPRRDGELVAEL